MPAEWLEFVGEVVTLSANALAILLAFGLATLIRGRLDAILIVINFWLLMELLATLAQPHYGFGELALARFFACALQLGFAFCVLWAWRRRRFISDSVAAH